MTARLTHFSKAACLCGLACLGALSVQAQTSEVLTNAAQIRNLTVDEAARALPVHLQGVVLADSAGGNSLVVQDDSEAIYATGQSSAVSRYHRGDLVDISGVTDPGGFAPIVLIHNCKRTGSAPLPDPRRVTFDDLLRKHYDAQYVEISGVVRSCEPASDPNDVRTKNGG